MKHVLYLSAAFVAVVTGNLSAQEKPSGYHSVACIKVIPGKSAEYGQFVSDNAHRLAPILFT